MCEEWEFQGKKKKQMWVCYNGNKMVEKKKECVPCDFWNYDDKGKIIRNDNFVGKSGHPPCPAPPLLGWVWEGFLKPDSDSGRVWVCSYPPRLALNI